MELAHNYIEGVIGNIANSSNRSASKATLSVRETSFNNQLNEGNGIPNPTDSSLDTLHKYGDLNEKRDSGKFQSELIIFIEVQKRKEMASDYIKGLLDF